MLYLIRKEIRYWQCHTYNKPSFLGAPENNSGRVDHFLLGLIKQTPGKYFLSRVSVGFC